MTNSEYGINIFNSLKSNFESITQENNDTLSSAYNYVYDNTKKDLNDNMTYPGGLQHLSTMFQQLFFRISDNQTSYNTSSTSSLSSQLSEMLYSPSSFFVSSLTPSLTDVNSYRFLSVTSLWFVLILNPISILFGTIGNLLTIYILITCNIVKLPVSFYAIMLNISDTLNLLIPVFIFWLDNCMNRTPERGYFRDKSNFLCKALMCPDQLFAALSAWYMCAVSFNRWYSVYRPSSFFIHMSPHALKTSSQAMKNHMSQVNRRQKILQSESSAAVPISSSSSLSSFSSYLNCCHCFAHNIKYRQHLRPFRNIAIITLLGILCCLYPIFMHELRPVKSTNRNYLDAKENITRVNIITWKRCYYSQKHEHVYDIIGIILSSFLHVLPLTFVGVMNLMIIVKLRERQNLMPISTNIGQSSSVSTNKNRITLNYLENDVPYASTNFSSRKNGQMFISEVDSIKDSPQLSSTKTHKDQSTITDMSSPMIPFKQTQTTSKNRHKIQKRHYSRDRTITIMLVSVALTYFILTIPYRLFWSYNVYIKRMYPEKLNSPVYLLKMHYIDHVLRTIRNMHYCTNFVFFILLSKSFRRKFQQLLIEHLLPKSMRTFNTNMDIYSEINNNNNNVTTNQLERHSINLQRKTKNNENDTIINNDILLGMQSPIEDLYEKSPNVSAGVSKNQRKKHSINEVDDDDILHELE